MPSSAAAAARNATLTQLVDDATRSDAHATILAVELHSGEKEIAWLSEALLTTQQRLAHTESTALQQHQQSEAALSAEQATQQRMADELRARYEEQEGLVSRLQTAQRVNEEWQERVRSVSAEFEATAADWQAQLTMADGKWRAMVDALRTRLATSEALNSDNAARIQQLSLENETLSGRLRTAQEDAATQRDAAKKAQASEAELAGKLHARDAELAELRGRLSSSTSEGNSHGAKVVELTGRLALVEGELLQAKELNATIPGLKGRLSDAEAALKLTGNRGGELEEALAAALGRCREKENEIAALEAEKEQLVDQLSTEAEELQSELNMAQQSLASTTNELAAEQEVAAEVVAKRQELLAVNALARKNADLTTELSSKLQDTMAALEQSQASVSTMTTVNGALEKRAVEAEARADAAGDAVNEAALAISARQEAEAALAAAQAETAELRLQIRQMVAHHSDHEAQAEADAEDAVVLRDETSRLAAQLASAELQLAGERAAREEAQAAARRASEVANSAEARAEAVLAASCSSPVMSEGGASAVELGKMMEQRERLEALQSEVEALRRQSAPSGFGESLLRTMGLAKDGVVQGVASGVACLGTERKKLMGEPISDPPLALMDRSHQQQSGLFERGASRGTRFSKESAEEEYDHYANLYAAAAAELPIGQRGGGGKHSRLDSYLASPRDRAPRSHSQPPREGGGGGGGKRHSSADSHHHRHSSHHHHHHRHASPHGTSGSKGTPVTKGRPPRAGMSRAQTMPPRRH